MTWVRVCFGYELTWVRVGIGYELVVGTSLLGKMARYELTGNEPEGVFVEWRPATATAAGSGGGEDDMVACGTCKFTEGQGRSLLSTMPCYLSVSVCTVA